MLKDTGYKEKFEMIQPWLLKVIEAVKKDLKQEHLKIDREFCKKYFLGKSLPQITIQEMAEAYRLDISGGNIGLGEFIASRWLLRHTDIYGFFENRLKNIQPDFEEITLLEDSFSFDLMEKAAAQFGAIPTYLFSVFNSVVFSDSVYKELRDKAENETMDLKKEEALEEIKSMAALRERHEREISSLSDRYEKKLNGLQQKYLRDTQSLKTKVAQLQKKLAALHE